MKLLLTTTLLIVALPMIAFEAIVSGNWDKFFDLVSQVPDGEKDVVAVLRPEDLPLVRKVRRMVIAKANPHAIEYYNSFTSILMTMTWKRELMNGDSRAGRIQALVADSPVSGLYS